MHQLLLVYQITYVLQQMNRASRDMPTFIAENTQVDAFVSDMHLIAVVNATRYAVAYLAISVLR